MPTPTSFLILILICIIQVQEEVFQSMKQHGTRVRRNIDASLHLKLGDTVRCDQLAIMLIVLNNNGGNLIPFHCICLSIYKIKLQLSASYLAEDRAYQLCLLM